MIVHYLVTVYNYEYLGIVISAHPLRGGTQGGTVRLIAVREMDHGHSQQMGGPRRGHTGSFPGLLFRRGLLGR